jgi:hypothetical protein
MLDTQTAPEGVDMDTPQGPYPRPSAAAIERAKTLFGITDIEKLGAALGYSRAGWWRARVGLNDPRLSDARRIARRLQMPLDDVFPGGTNA